MVKSRRFESPWKLQYGRLQDDVLWAGFGHIRAEGLDEPAMCPEWTYRSCSNLRADLSSDTVQGSGLGFLRLGLADFSAIFSIQEKQGCCECRVSVGAI